MAGTGESKQDGLGLSGTNPKVGQFSSFPASAESLRCSDETRDIDSVKNRGVLSHLSVEHHRTGRFTTHNHAPGIFPETLIVALLKTPAFP